MGKLMKVLRSKAEVKSPEDLGFATTLPTLTDKEVASFRRQYKTLEVKT